ncbi:MAG: DsbA family protein [Kiloniellaceae bacterium]
MIGGAVLAIGAATGAYVLVSSDRREAAAPESAGDTAPDPVSLPPRVPGLRVVDGDRILGAPGAPITIIEYSSLTCPHCAAFHREALPQIKKEWIAKGKVRLVYRHFPLDGLGLRAAAVANCIEGERYFAFLNVLFENQQRWARADDPIKTLGQYATLAGLSKKRFQACVTDQAEMDRIVTGAKVARESYKVESTPTLFIDGRKFPGTRPFSAYEAIFKAIVAQT